MTIRQMVYYVFGCIRLFVFLIIPFCMYVNATESSDLGNNQEYLDELLSSIELIQDVSYSYTTEIIYPPRADDLAEAELILKETIEEEKLFIQEQKITEEQKKTLIDALLSNKSEKIEALLEPKALIIPETRVMASDRETIVTYFKDSLFNRQQKIIHTKSGIMRVVTDEDGNIQGKEIHETELWTRKNHKFFHHEKFYDEYLKVKLSSIEKIDDNIVIYQFIPRPSFTTDFELITINYDLTKRFPIFYECLRENYKTEIHYSKFQSIAESNLVFPFEETIISYKKNNLQEWDIENIAIDQIHHVFANGIVQAKDLLSDLSIDKAATKTNKE